MIKGNVQFNYKPEEIYRSMLKWRLMEGTNDIYLGAAGYSSRRGIKSNLIVYGLITAEPDNFMAHNFL